MRWMVASDIHGSSYYCQKMVAAFESESADKLLLLGDLLYHGPRNDLPRDYDPKAVISMLNSLRKDILCIQGNCEAPVDQMVLDFPVLNPYGFIQVGNHFVYCTHGHLDLPKIEEGTIISGHTHIYKYEKVDGILYLNPGSVSIPKGGCQHSYMILEEDKILLKNVETQEVISCFSW